MRGRERGPGGPGGDGGPGVRAGGGSEDRLDLPMGGAGEDAPPPDHGPSEVLRRREGGGPPRSPGGQRGGQGGGGGRRRGLTLALVLVLVALGVVAGYLLPRRSPPVLRPSESLLDFGSQRVGTGSPPRELQLGNAGQRTLEVAQVSVVSADPGGTGAAADFALAADGCSGARLAAGSGHAADTPGVPCALRVVFTPSAAGARRATLRIAGNAANAPLDLPLEGTGLAPEVSAEPAALDFGSRPVGAATAAAQLTLRNTGSAPLAIKAALVEGDAATDFHGADDRCSGALLPPGGACALGFTFTPTATGERRARLKLWSDALGEPPAIELAGVGEAPRIVAEPAAVDFGERTVGLVGEAMTVRLTNSAGASEAAGVVNRAGLLAGRAGRLERGVRSG